jgi:mevalonate pyrophosphate decarboxylase
MTLTWINGCPAPLAEHRARPCLAAARGRRRFKIFMEFSMSKLNVSIVAACLVWASASAFAADDKKAAEPSKPGASAPAASAPAGKAAAAPAPKKEKKGGC